MDELHPVHFKKRDPATVRQTRITNQSEFEKVYTLGRELGKGAFGTVRLATHKETRKKYAVKLQDKSKAGSSGITQLAREVDIMKMIDHPHCVNLNEVFETREKMYIVMEYAPGGEVLQHLMDKTFYPEDEGRLIVKRLASAVAYLHQQDIVHRDIKLENLLIEDEDDLVIKLSDFGLSITLGRDDNFMSQTCGTPMYMAPEVIDEKGYSKQCDVWSIGVIMYFVLCGHPPFYAASEQDLYAMIREAKPTFSEEPWNDLPPTAKSLVASMLKPDPASRISAKEILDHAWIRGESDDNGPSTILDMMKSYNLERRFRKAQNVVIACQRFMYGIKTEKTSTAAAFGTNEMNEEPCAHWNLSHKITDMNATGNYGPPMEYDQGSHVSLTLIGDGGQSNGSNPNSAEAQKTKKADGGADKAPRLLRKRNQQDQR